jgi:hypothetical protein
MLQIDNVRQIPPGTGVTIYGDDEQINVFYLLPNSPRYRLNADGTPAFRFMSYRTAVDREGGKKAGGFALFDVEFVVDAALMPEITEKLTEEVTQSANRLGISPVPPLVFGTLTYTKGETKLFVAGSDGTFVQKLNNPGKPSLFGNNVATFALELTEDGATFFEQAMQGAGGAVSVVYDLWFWARLPPIVVDAYWNATKFYSFYQTIDIEWNFWGEDDYRETVRETMISSESETLNFDWGGVTDEKIRAPIRDWAQRSLEDAVERNMIEAIAPVPDDQRKAPDGIENVTRDISSTKISSVSVHYRESQTVEWNLAPQGILQNITELTDAGGAKLKWSDYSKQIDLDNPFFRELRVDTYVNADFEHLPIHSVEVKVLYNGRPMPNLAPGQPEGEVVLSKADDIGKFATYVENDNWKYTYSYQINYRGESQIYQSPEIETNEGNLTIGVDDVGILTVNASAGDLNWDEIDRAVVTFRYEDTDVEPIEEQFQLTKAAPEHLIQQVIFQPMRKNYRYAVKYYMKGGREYEGPELEARSQNLFINDVFGARKTVSLRGIGDFTSRINTVFVDLEYVDTTNNYTLTRSQALSSAMLFFDWTFPVINPDLGEVTYKATVSYKDGTSEDIPKTVAVSDTILLPPVVEDFLEVTLVTDLLDWEEVRLARVAMSYEDPDQAITENKDFIFSADKHDMATWKVELKNKELDDYTYEAMYFLNGGLQKSVGPTVTDERTLILDVQQS